MITWLAHGFIHLLVYIFFLQVTADTMASNETNDEVSCCQSDSLEGPKKIITGRPKASLVWELFDYDGSSDSSTCKIEIKQDRTCGKSIKGKNPTNLKQHLAKSHPDEYTKFLEKERNQKEMKSKKVSAKQPTISAIFTPSPYNKDSLKQKKITAKVATFIGCANIGTIIVENQEFQKLLHEFGTRSTT